MDVNKVYCGDALEIVPTLPKATLIFADHPDNLGLSYDGFTDHRGDYHEWLKRVVEVAVKNSWTAWLSVYYKYMFDVWESIPAFGTDIRLFMWRFTFGQHRSSDCGNGFRPIFRIRTGDADLYPGAIRVESQRQRNGDKRANPDGRVPDDVWEFPRVCGNFPERRKWHPNQHPEALIERIVKFTCKPGDTVIDMFAGTGTVNRVCKKLGIDCIGIEISETYCEKIKAELKDRPV